MPIEIRFSRFAVATIFFLSAFSAFSQQNDLPDTVNRKPFERYWTKPRWVPRLGVGVQDGPFAEVGVAFHKIYVHPLAMASAAPYVTIESVILKDDFIMGAKAGYEVIAGLFGVAADMTYYTDFTRRSLMVTPKLGLSVFGFVNLFYGYNIPLSEDEFKSIDRNRFSLTFNLNRDYFSVRTAQKRKEHYRERAK